MFRKIPVEAEGEIVGYLDDRNRSGECHECGFNSELYPTLKIAWDGVVISSEIWYICQSCYDTKRGE